MEENETKWRSSFFHLLFGVHIVNYFRNKIGSPAYDWDQELQHAKAVWGWYTLDSLNVSTK